MKTKKKKTALKAVIEIERDVEKEIKVYQNKDTKRHTEIKIDREPEKLPFNAKTIQAYFFIFTYILARLVFVDVLDLTLFQISSMDDFNPP